MKGSSSSRESVFGGLQPKGVCLATLNISGPSVERARRLGDYLLGLRADVLVITETRANAGTQLLADLLEKAGYALIQPPGLDGGERGAMIAHRLNALERRVRKTAELAHRLPIAWVELGGIMALLVGAYVPSRDASASKIMRKQGFLGDLCAFVERHYRTVPIILMGDLNIVGRDHVPRYPAFRTWEYDALERLGGSGLKDAHSLVNPSAQAYSWIGRTGCGYKYDYGFVSSALADVVSGCAYDHSPREAGLSDHAALLMSLDTSRSGDGVFDTAGGGGSLSWGRHELADAG